MVLDGSFALYNAFFESHEQDAPPGGWSMRGGELTLVHHFHKAFPTDPSCPPLTPSRLVRPAFDKHRKEIPADAHVAGFHFTDKQLQWFYDRGCKMHKVEAGPGDVILWDSRCIHYGAAAEGDVPRVATCEFRLCTMPPISYALLFVPAVPSSQRGPAKDCAILLQFRKGLRTPDQMSATSLQKMSPRREQKSGKRQLRSLTIP